MSIQQPEASLAPLDEKTRQEAVAAGPFVELGQTGLRRNVGWLDEEFLPALKGRKAVEVFKEMSLNDPTVTAALFAIDRLVRNVEWRVEPAGKSREDAKAAELVETCMEDMDTTWEDFISEALSCMTYGWSYHEIVYKQRRGIWETNPSRRSKFTDGLVGWRKIAPRSQDTLHRWEFDDKGDLLGMWQIAPPTYQQVFIPINRALLFRYRHFKNSPEGISMLRGAYLPWFYKKRMMEFEAVGVERDLAGVPIMWLPAEMLKAAPGTDAYKSVQAFKNLVKGMRRNDQEGAVLPMAYDQDTNQPLFKFELLASGGARAHNTPQIIERYDLAILQTVLADFIKVGHEQTGSYNLHTDKTGIFRTSLNSLAGGIADVLNRHAIPRLFLANGWKPAQLPKIVPDDVDSPDIAQLVTFMSGLSNMGVQWFPDGELENYLRQTARLPELTEEQLEARRQMQLRTEATAFAQANLDYVATQQQLVAGLSGQSQPQGPGQQGTGQEQTGGAGQDQAGAQEQGPAAQQGGGRG